MIHADHPATLRGQATRRRIIAAAYQVCSENGLEALHTRQIAQGAGVNVATLHYYFSSKHDLTLALLQWVLTRFKEESAEDSQSLAVELNETVSWADRDPGMIALWHDYWNASRRDLEVRQVLHDHLLEWRSKLAALLDQDALPANATLLLGLSLGLPMVASTLPEMWNEETLQAAVTQWIGRRGSRGGEKAPDGQDA